MRPVLSRNVPPIIRVETEQREGDNEPGVIARNGYIIRSEGPVEREFCPDCKKRLLEDDWCYYCGWEL